jgi:hypothetical protein
LEKPARNRRAKSGSIVQCRAYDELVCTLEKLAQNQGAIRTLSSSMRGSIPRATVCFERFIALRG